MRKTALFAFGLVVTILVALGLVVLASASEPNSMRYHGGDPYFFLKRQFLYLGCGLVVATCVSLFDYRRWRDWPWLTWLFFGTVIVLLATVFAFPKINGSYRWINLGVLRLQPSEFAKLAVVIVTAVWLDRQAWRVELPVRGAVVPALLIGALAVPILAEPDFGSVMVVGCAGILVMFLAGVRILHLGILFVCGFAGVAALVAANANRMARIMAFFSGGADGGAVADPAAQRAAWQATQALVAFKNGGIWGQGLGESMQRELYLPEAHTDFIFAIGAEELGLCFSIAVIVLFLAFFALAIYVARKATDRFGRFLAFGMAFIVFFQAMFNLGVVSKALPTKGMALPFFSYGGTNLLSSFFAVGIILSVGIHSYREACRWRK